jgi:acetyl esterase/lipase
MMRLALGNAATEPHQPTFWDGLIWFNQPWLGFLLNALETTWSLFINNDNTPAALSEWFSSPYAAGIVPGSEDCLFLDVVVPGKALRRQQKLPVVNWIHAGSYVAGSKDFFNPGLAAVKQSQGNLIAVAANYRVWNMPLSWNKYR